jgi:quercetin dioxygenase-like cupin family protein
MIRICLLALMLATALVQAQTPVARGVTGTRLYSGSDGLTHAEAINLSLATGKDGTQPELLKANNIRFATRGPGTSDDWHTAPGRQYLVTLQGTVEIEIGDGKKVTAGPGSILLIEDTTGKGHRATVVSKDEWHVLFIPIAK